MTTATAETADRQDFYDVGPPTRTTHAARKMPSMRAVEGFHGLPPATCYRCGIVGRTERAHVIDRTAYPVEAPADVIDDIANLLPLCVRCHRSQPTFYPGEEELALAWFALDAVGYASIRYPDGSDEIRDLVTRAMVRSAEADEILEEIIAATQRGESWGDVQHLVSARENAVEAQRVVVDHYLDRGDELRQMAAETVASLWSESIGDPSIPGHDYWSIFDRAMQRQVVAS